MSPNAAGIGIGARSEWVALPQHLAEVAGCESLRDVGEMTEDLNALAARLVRLEMNAVLM